MAKDDWSFWRDETDSRFFSREHRVKFLVGVVCSIGFATGIFTFWEEIGLSFVSSRIIGFGLTFFAMPSLFAIDLFFAGNKAGKKIKDKQLELQRLIDHKLSATATKRATHEALRDLKEILERPTVGTGTMHQKMYDGLNSQIRSRQRSDAIDCLRKYDIAVADNPNLTVGYTDIESQTDLILSLEMIRDKFEMIAAFNT